MSVVSAQPACIQITAATHIYRGYKVCDAGGGLRAKGRTLPKTT